MHFHCAFKGKKEKNRRLQRVHWDYPEDGSVCPGRLSLFTNHSSWSKDRPHFSPQTLSLLEWSSAVVWAKNLRSDPVVTVHHKTLWEAPATCCCLKSKVCRCSKTLHKLQRVKSPPKERFPGQRDTMWPPRIALAVAPSFPNTLAGRGTSSRAAPKSQPSIRRAEEPRPPRSFLLSSLLMTGSPWALLPQF